MKYLTAYRDAAACGQVAEALAKLVTRPWTIMEVCGGQTHSIIKFGLDQLLPPEITLIHGPGCPVCVTPLEMIEKALQLAARPEVTFCSFGDMLRVPGLDRDLLSVRAAGGDVRIVYSPLDAVQLARELPDREVIFFGVGFETTAPGNAMAVHQARRLRLPNFSMLVSHVLVPPALEALLSSPERRVQAFLAAGHVCTVMGYREYEPIAAKHGIPIVVTGFEPTDILQGVYGCVRQLERGQAEVQNQYSRSVKREGNLPAQALLTEVFEVTDRKWRGLGAIPRSGLRLNSEHADFDAETRFGLSEQSLPEPEACHSGLVLQGIEKPFECPAFGCECTPEHPLGATMVSSEGACAAYYRYRSHHLTGVTS
ncbi:MAG: hydrogenase formation protein HypD [Armatimonadota bacterium]